MSTINMKAGEELLEMYQATTPFLEEYPWELEEERWAELISILFSGIGTHPAVAKKAVNLLKELDVLMPTDLIKGGETQIAFIHQVLLQAGMEIAEAEQSTKILVKLSGLVDNKWNGHIQKFLRSYGDKMVKDIQSYLTRSGVEDEQSKKIATVWLQNVCNLPILLEGDAHIKSFCARYKMTEADLLELLDGLGLNACLVDDLISIHAEPGQSKNGTKNQGQKKKPAKKKIS